MNNTAEDKKKPVETIPAEAPTWFMTVVDTLTGKIDAVRTDLTERMDKLDGRMDKLDGRIDTLEEGMNLRIDTLEKGMNLRIDTLEEGMNLRIDKQEEGMNRRFETIENKLDDVNKHVGAIGNTLGRFSELLVFPSIAKAFRDKGYTFLSATQNARLKQASKIAAEVDILVKDKQGGYIAVEIKTSANTEQIKKYRQSLKHLRDLIKQHDTQFKHLVGGFASLVYSTETQECILNEGLYALMPTGLDVELFVPENFQAIEF